jgi:tetratricopeptide (TPR) repeat protein
LEKASGLEHTPTFRKVNNLGLLYDCQGNLVKAEQMYQQALQGYEKALGVDKTSTYVPALNTFRAFGSLFERQGYLAKARIMYSKASVGYEKVMGSDYQRSRSLEDIIHALDAYGQR